MKHGSFEKKLQHYSLFLKDQGLLVFMLFVRDQCGFEKGGRLEIKTFAVLLYGKHFTSFDLSFQVGNMRGQTK